MSDEQQGDDRGVPAWVMTFADLMTLLMCFFVLLLSFSEMDVLKFKQLSGSMKDAFGVQTEVEAKTIPKGTSVIAQEFSPGKPEPSAINQVRQFTIDTDKNTLEFDQTDDKDKKVKEDLERIRRALKDEIEQGLVDVAADGSRIVIHILEKGSFKSGIAEVEHAFLPVLIKIRGLLVSTPGEITVSGHTDDVPISTSRFRSNWELSAARAVSVAHELMRFQEIEQDRFLITGHGETRSLVENDTPANRAKNRRVDISIVRGPEASEIRQISVNTNDADEQPAESP